MPKRLKILLLISIGSIAASFDATGGYPTTPSVLERAEALLERRLYEEAVVEYGKALKQDSANVEAVKGLAGVYEQKRDWTSALAWWERALEMAPGANDVMIGRWNALLETAGDDSTRLEEMRTRVKGEVYALLERDGGSEENLSLAVDGLRLVENDSLYLREIEDNLVALFPHGQKSYEVIGNRFYEGLYPIWRQDSLKIGYLNGFLDEYPETEWRFTAYQYMLSSLATLGEMEELVRTSERLISEDGLNPFALNYVAYLYLESDLEDDDALDYARWAVELESMYEKPANKPEEQWTLEKRALYGDARMNCARALLALGDADGAEGWIREALEKNELDVNHYRSTCRYWYVLGQIQEAQDLTEDATRSYVQALIEGDVGNRWSARADSAISPLHGFEPGSRQELLELSRRVVGYEGIRFVDVTEEMGLGERKESRIAWGDYDDDGYDDLLLSGRRLFHNFSGEEFLDVTQDAQIGESGTGAVWGDYDNDGFIDFYAISSRAEGDRLWHSNGDGTFTDVTDEVGGPSDSYSTEGAAWADFDGNGYLDLYVANYEIWSEHRYLPDLLYKNSGAGEFEEIGRQAGIVPPFGEDRAGRGVACVDYDMDGDVDIHVSNYRLQENFLWTNMGEWSFENMAPFSGIAGDEVAGWWGHTIGSEWGDYDNDGDFDLVSANLAHPRYIEFSNKTMLYENTGEGQPLFEERREEAGIKFEETHSDPAWGDVDKDGDLDLYITSIYEGRRSFLYENCGDGTFRDVTWLSGVRAFNGWGCAYSDYDRDGDLDLYVASGSGGRLFRNEGNDSNWLEVKLVGTLSNRSAIGAKLTATQGGRSQIREIQGGKGTTSQHSLTAFFGFGEDERPVRLKIVFPSGSTTVIERVSLNQLVVIEEE